MRDTPNVAIIGCGRMGQRRAKALGESSCLVWACDAQAERAEKLCSTWSIDWHTAVEDSNVDIVIVCTTPDVAPMIAAAAARNGKHVLIDKPGAHTAAEFLGVATQSALRKVKVRVGYNLRYHRAIREAHWLVSQGEIGDLMYIRGVYGHGGRLGMEKEWRCDPKISGGGELIDQGVHLIDLSRWFVGDFDHVWGRTDTCFWDINTCFWDIKVEDNAWLELQCGVGVRASLHASWTEWKNTFRFEIFGKRGKLQIDGLGGSYGVERLTHYFMSPKMGLPDTTIWEYPGEDNSFEVEWHEFLQDIREDREPSPGIEDAQAVLRVVEEVYGVH